MVKAKKKERVWEVPKAKQPRKRRLRTEKQQDQSDSQSSANIKFQVGQQHENKLQSINIADIDNSQHEAQCGRQRYMKYIGLKKQREESAIKQSQLSLVREILYGQIQASLSSELQSERPYEQEIITNFLRLESPTDELPDLLCKYAAIVDAYGSPGIGKTYLIRNILISEGLYDNSLWINCFSIISKNKLNLHQRQPGDGLKQVRVVVLDEFDQLQSWLNSNAFCMRLKLYLKDIEARFVQEYSQLKYILISNKSYKSFDNSNARLSTIINPQRIMQTAFLPYPLKSISSILHKKITQIEQAQSSLKFNRKLIDILINKIYSTSQDIRKVMEFLLHNYELLLCEVDQKEADVTKKISFIDQISKIKVRKEVEENLDCHYFKMVNHKQRNLLKGLILGFEQAQKQNKSYLISEAYKEGRRLAMNRHQVDLWLQEWTQMGIISKRQLYFKNQHHLDRVYEIKMLLPLKECKNYFY